MALAGIRHKRYSSTIMPLAGRSASNADRRSDPREKTTGTRPRDEPGSARPTLLRLILIATQMPLGAISPQDVESLSSSHNFPIILYSHDGQNRWLVQPLHLRPGNGGSWQERQPRHGMQMYRRRKQSQRSVASGHPFGVVTICQQVVYNNLRDLHMDLLGRYLARMW